MTQTIKKQILAIRDSGETNMFDARTVQVIANDREFYELVIFIEEHMTEYLHFIVSGEFTTEFGADDTVIIAENK